MFNVKLNCKIILPIAVFFIIQVSLPISADALMLMELTGSANSSIVEYSLSGTSTATNTFGSPFVGAGFDISSGPDLFPIEINGTDYGSFFSITGGGIFKNETTDVESPVLGIWLQDEDLFGVERFGVLFDVSQNVSAGDIFSWSGSGSIDLSSKGLLFGDLTLGEAFGDSSFVGGLDGAIRLSDAAPAPVPEPSTFILLGAGLAGLVAWRKKRT